MVGSDFDGDYARWFALILDRPAKPLPLPKIHDAILSLMDRAMIRGAAKYSPADEAQLKLEREHWLAEAGSPSGAQVVDRFLAVVRMARHANPRDVKRLDNEVYDLKQQWRSFSPRAEQPTPAADS
ncbi:hypothetical protein [Sphingomonas gilva]|uniref:hypothetical protein n=1 Tax=Sphingomonas gilva TaxID=2305907 RepID=UPI0011C3B209|nr:hypothetical protein [Sphingomonas gilva]